MSWKSSYLGVLLKLAGEFFLLELGDESGSSIGKELGVALVGLELSELLWATSSKMSEPLLSKMLLLWTFAIVYRLFHRNSSSEAVTAKELSRPTKPTLNPRDMPRSLLTSYRLLGASPST